MFNLLLLLYCSKISSGDKALCKALEKRVKVCELRVELMTGDRPRSTPL